MSVSRRAGWISAEFRSFAHPVAGKRIWLSEGPWVGPLPVNTRAGTAQVPALLSTIAVPQVQSGFALNLGSPQTDFYLRGGTEIYTAANLH